MNLSKKHQLKNYLRIFVLLVGVTVLLWNCAKEEESIEVQSTKSFQNNNLIDSSIDYKKTNSLKSGLNKRIRIYNKNHSENLFFNKYGELNSENAVTIKFHEIDSNFMIVVPFKNDNEKLLIAYFKEGKRTFKILRNKKYQQKNNSSSEKAFLDNLDLLFSLTSGNGSDITTGASCRSTLLYEDFENCTAAYQDTCTGHIRIISTLGKHETCGGEFDEVIVIGDSGSENEGDGNNNGDNTDDDTNSDDTNGDDDTDNECFEYECEDDERGSNNVNAWTTKTILFVNPGQEITDINKHLDCFNITQSATLTIYVDQPVVNSSDTWSGSITSPDIGHTFISISQNGITRTLGFYPEGGIKPKISNDANGILVDDSEHLYDVSASRSISAGQLTSLLTSIESYGIDYNLDHNNCSDFGLFMVNQRGFNLSDTSGSWPGGGGTNPGNLGQDLRSDTTTGTTISNTGGTAPKNSGTCP